MTPTLRWKKFSKRLPCRCEAEWEDEEEEEGEAAVELLAVDCRAEKALLRQLTPCRAHRNKCRYGRLLCWCSRLEAKRLSADTCGE